MQWLGTLLVLAAFPLGQAEAALVGISQTGGRLDNLWVVGGDSFQTRIFSVPAGTTGPLSGKTISIFDYVDDRPTQGARPFGLLSSSSISSSFHRVGSTANLTTLSYTGATFLNGNLLQNNAQNGTDNYVGFRIQGSDSQYYYGWMQFELNQLVAGQTAVRFLGGVVESTPGTSFSASAVPEPSAFSLLAMGLGVVLRCRRRTV